MEVDSSEVERSDIDADTEVTLRYFTTMIVCIYMYIICIW